MPRTYDDAQFIDTFEHEYTWLNGFMRNVRRFSERPAVIDPETDRVWSYRSLNLEANRLAHALQKDGVRKDDVVMSALHNSAEFCTAYIGPRKLGAVLLAANFNLAAGEMALLINHNKPKVVLYTARIRDVVVQAAVMCMWKPLRFVMTDNRENLPLPAGHVLYEDYLRDQSGEEPQRDFRPHIYDEVVRLCTSGTSALPKSVPVNDINEVLSAHDVIMQYPLSSRDVCLNMTPWFHRGGCHCGGPCPVFYAGGAVVALRMFRPQTVLDWTAAYGITFLTGTPSNLEMLCRAQEHTARDLSGLRGIVAMGGPLSKAACLRFRTVLTPRIFNGYGTTETFWNSFLRPYDLPDKAGSVGCSCIDDEVRVVAMNGTLHGSPDDMVPHDGVTEGEIIIHAPGKTTCSYYKGDAMGKATFYKGWMYTGDTGTWDEDWVVTVHGRRDDMMVVAGENIYPAQIEEAVCEHPKVQDCMVTSLPDDVRGQAVAAYIVAADESLSLKEISDFCAASPLLSKYKKPRYFAFVQELPYSETGKRLYRTLRERAVSDLESGVLKKAGS